MTNATEETEGRRIFDVDGNGLTLLPGGPERLDALKQMIRSAEHRLDLYFYMFERDSCSVEIRDALLEACGRGVAVTLLIDAFGSALTPDYFFAPLIRAGARFTRFGKRRSTRYLIRDHQKMAIADGQRALIGGFNIGEDYFASYDDPHGWRDMGLHIEGPLAGELEKWFDSLAAWTLDSKQRFRDLRQMVRDWRPGVGRAIWLMGGPLPRLSGWAQHIKHDLQAGRRIDLAAAYFSPGGGILRRLTRLARAGEALLVTAGKSDNMATIGAARHLYRRLRRSGVRIVEHGLQKFHAKLIVIDDIAYIGSANFDMRSLFLNVEVMLRIEDATFAAAVREQIGAMAAQGRAIDSGTYRMMAGPLSRLRWWFDYLLVGVLDYTVTRRLLRRDKGD